ncbi:sensor histidine kinase [Dyella monticola]|uniref:sensor histidine kinase n=1 Tax=Dyella monticola TaxID=1927958 RepID=UPI0013141A57|nr:histidine kinase [Dyella monticola]
MSEQPGLMRYDALLFVFYSLAALPITGLLRAVWRREIPLRTISWLLLVSTFVTALVATALFVKVALSIGVMTGGFHWNAILLRMQTIWFLLMAYCAMYIGVGYQLVALEETRRALAATALAKEAELKALRYQVHPHFLFNTLNAISTLVIDERPGDATRMLAQLADFLRMTLTQQVSHEVSVSQELAFTEHYLDIEKVRLGERLTVDLAVSSNALDAAVPYLLLQPLVENAIRHGIARRPEGGQLRIDIEVVAERLHLTVWNQGVAEQGESSPDEGEGSAIGLQNVRDRLSHLYATDYQFAMSVAEDGSCLVEAHLPYRAMAHSQASLSGALRS